MIHTSTRGIWDSSFISFSKRSVFGNHIPLELCSHGLWFPKTLLPLKGIKWLSHIPLLEWINHLYSSKFYEKMLEGYSGSEYGQIENNLRKCQYTRNRTNEREVMIIIIIISYHQLSSWHFRMFAVLLNVPNHHLGLVELCWAINILGLVQHQFYWNLLTSLYPKRGLK